jgi:hypothetical protein
MCKIFFKKYTVNSILRNLHYCLGLVIILITGTMLFCHGMDLYEFFNFTFYVCKVFNSFHC